MSGYGAPEELAVERLPGAILDDVAQDDDRPPICPRCGVTMVPATLSAEEARDGEWACLECEELGEDD